MKLTRLNNSWSLVCHKIEEAGWSRWIVVHIAGEGIAAKVYPDFIEGKL